jgi:cytochrome b6-f complex iron-sulfur subunit
MAAARSAAVTVSPSPPVLPAAPGWPDVGELRGGGLSRRQLLRRSLAAALGLTVVEAGVGIIGFLWPNISSGFGGRVTLGDMSAVAERPAVPGTSLRSGAPAYFQEARAYIQLVDPTLPFRDGADLDGSGATTNVRALYQRCPHLGCRPNFCPSNYWFECPCHQSRYDRLGTKVRELGPAARSMDRFAVHVSAGILSVDTSALSLGPLPVALGQPGLIPSRGGTCI